MSTDTGQTTGQAGAGKSGSRSFPATCTPVLSSSWSDGPGRMIEGDALSSPCPSSWLARLVALPADGWLASFDGGCPQRSDHLVGGGFGHLNQRVPVGDLNRADVAATEP